MIDAAARAASDLDELGVAAALVGGLAVGARAEPRFTRDVDIVVAVEDDEQAERLVHALSGRGYSIDTVIEQAKTGRLATARLRHRSSPQVFVDLLFASSGIEREIVMLAQPVRYRKGTTLRAAITGHLIALKVLSESEHRLQDRIDLRALAEVATYEDWAVAREAVRLIRKRGFHRGRALSRRLRRWSRSRT